MDGGGGGRGVEGRVRDSDIGKLAGPLFGGGSCVVDGGMGGGGNSGGGGGLEGSGE